MAHVPIKAYLPSWKERCLEKLNKRGAKSDLARKLQEIYADGEKMKPLSYWTKRVNDIFQTDSNPSGEFVLAISNILKVR